MSVPTASLTQRLAARSTLGCPGSRDGLLAEAEARSLRANEALPFLPVCDSHLVVPQLGFCEQCCSKLRSLQIQTLVPGQAATRGTAPSYGSSLSQLS